MEYIFKFLYNLSILFKELGSSCGYFLFLFFTLGFLTVLHIGGLFVQEVLGVAGTHCVLLIVVLIVAIFINIKQVINNHIIFIKREEFFIASRCKGFFSNKLNWISLYFFFSNFFKDSMQILVCLIHKLKCSVILILISLSSIQDLIQLIFMSLIIQVLLQLFQVPHKCKICST